MILPASRLDLSPATRDQGQDSLQGGARRRVGVVDVWIQLDRYPTVIADGLDGREDGREIDGALARNQVMMNAGGGDVFQVEMADMFSNAANGWSGIVADAIGMADIEIHADGRRVDVLHELQELVGGLDEQ